MKVLYLIILTVGIIVAVTVKPIEMFKDQQQRGITVAPPYKTAGPYTTRGPYTIPRSKTESSLSRDWNHLNPPHTVRPYTSRRPSTWNHSNQPYTVRPHTSRRPSTWNHSNTNPAIPPYKPKSQYPAKAGYQTEGPNGTNGNQSKSWVYRQESPHIRNEDYLNKEGHKKEGSYAAKTQYPVKQIK